jgi:capsular polysaccharide transport system ATP-binding protein
VIIIRNLYKKYKNHNSAEWVLKNINLTIPDKVSVGLVGKNGAGKSTLLRLISGMDTPDKGEVIRSSRVSWPIGLSGGFNGTMTGRQNTKFIARIHGNNKQIPEIIKKVEDFAEIGSAFDEPVKTYSSGMKARLGFGVSLAFDFDVYISDEATAVGDSEFKKKASKAFKDRVEKSSLIIVSHSEGILKELCEAGVLVKDGEAFWFDSIHDALDEYKRTQN